MKKLIVCGFVFAAVFANAEQFRLKYAASVDVLDDNGKIVGAKKLKAGTLVTLADSVSVAAVDEGEKSASGKKSVALIPSDIAPAMWKNKRPAHAVLRADLELSSYYNYSWRDKQKTHWSVQISAKNQDWSYGESIYGYVQKSSPVGKRIAEALKDGKEHRALVKVKPTKYDDEDDLAVIEDFQILTED